MKNFESVSNLRNNLRPVKVNISNTAGCYRWWFREDGAKELLSALPVNWDNIQVRTIDGSKYYTLYFGISDKLIDRLDWHINQRHTMSQVSAGTISTLRTTISSLLGKPVSESETDVNNFIDKYCYVEFENDSNAKARETEELRTNYYPLNIQENEVVDAETINCLKGLRKEFGKR